MTHFTEHFLILGNSTEMLDDNIDAVNAIWLF